MPVRIKLNARRQKHHLSSLHYRLSARAPSRFHTKYSGRMTGCGENGFIVFLDANGDLTRAVADETVLRAHPAAPEGVNLVIANDAGYISFAPTGLGRGNVGGVAAVSQVLACDERGLVETSQDSSAGRLFVATPLGRAAVIRDYSLVNDAATLMGATCP